MSAAKSERPVVSEAFEDLAGGSIYTDSLTTDGRRPETRSFQPVRDNREIVRSFLTGVIDSHQLPDEIRAVWSDGFRAGCQRRQAGVDRLNHEADRLWFELHNPAEARAERERMLRDFQVVQNRKTTAEKWAELDRIAAERAQAVSA